MARACIDKGVSCCFDAPVHSHEELFFHQKRGELLEQQLRLQDFLAMSAKVSSSQGDDVVTLGHAKDRIAHLTQILARKEYQVLFINREKDFYKRAFKETHDQNTQIKKELAQFQKRLAYQLSDSHILG